MRTIEERESIALLRQQQDDEFYSGVRWYQPEGEGKPRCKGRADKRAAYRRCELLLGHEGRCKA